MASAALLWLRAEASSPSTSMASAALLPPPGCTTARVPASSCRAPGRACLTRASEPLVHLRSSPAPISLPSAPPSRTVPATVPVPAALAAALHWVRAPGRACPSA
eukprot:3456143-Alexandrium_andersonii.AAC.1